MSRSKTPYPNAKQAKFVLPYLHNPFEVRALFKCSWPNANRLAEARREHPAI